MQTGTMTASAGQGWSTRTAEGGDGETESPQYWPLLSCRCDDQTAEKLKTSCGHCDGAENICTQELETHVTRLGEQLQTLGCSRETLGTPQEEVSRALRSQGL